MVASPQGAPGGPTIPGASRRTALFVDFDNVYLTLQAADPRCAEAFATDPLGWLHWLERSLSSEPVEPARRRILMRRCYLNPSAFRRFRSDFTRAGFKVMDCPSLTRSGKSSTDIHVVMDVLDALEHPVHYDEFILCSGDADFTPLLQRLREHDRRTAILAIGAAAAAYKSCADEVIDEMSFVQEALGLSPASLIAAHEASQRLLHPLADPELLQRIAMALRTAASQQGILLATELPGIYKRFPEFPKSNWLGYFSLRSLTEAVVSLDPALALVDGEPWRIEWRPLGIDIVEEGGDAAEASALREFVQRLQDATGAPALLPAEHAAAFEALAAGLAEPVDDAVSLSRQAAEHLAEIGRPMQRSHLTFILQTLAHAGQDLAELQGTTATALADRYREALLSMLDAAGTPATPQEIEMLDRITCRPTRERASGAPAST